MFWHMLLLESKKTFARRLFWIGLLIMVLVLAFFASMFYAFRVGLPMTFLLWPGSLVYALNNAIGFASWSSYGTYLLIILVGTITAQEYSWRTMQLWLSHGVPRPLLLGTKFLLAMLAALAIVIACLFTIGGLSIFFSLQAKGALDVASVDFGQLLLSCLRTAYAMLPYGALAFFLAVTTRSAVVAVGGSLAFIGVIETALSNLLPLLGAFPTRMVQFLPTSLATVLTNQNYALGHLAIPVKPVQLDLFSAMLTVAIYTLALVALATFSFLRQDMAR